MSGKFSGGEVLLEKCLLSAFHLHHAVTLLYNGFLMIVMIMMIAGCAK